MASATIIKVWQDTDNYYVAAQVAEGGALGNVEYSASVAKASLPDQTNPTVKAALTAALTVVRNKQLNGSISTIGAITGGVTI